MEKDYKNTLNLPETPFPMKAQLSLKEPVWVERFAKEGLYHRIRRARAGKKPFILVDGPPYANGAIHLGHALNKILKDIIVKSRTLFGEDAPFIPGWDCHGLPIELNVEKKIGKPGHKVSEEVFREACRKYAASQMDLQSRSFQRLGILADWTNPYTTMDFSFEANTVRALGQCLEKGYIRRGFRPVHWCLACGSALAEAEVEYQDKTSQDIDVVFQAVESAAFAERFAVTLPPGTAVGVVIWTTTPWTLPGNEAVALSQEAEYVLAKVGARYVVFAQERQADLEARWELPCTLLGSATGEMLQGCLLAHPFLERTVPLIVSTHVLMDSGTGAVHTAPSFGPEDFIVGQRYGLSMRNPIEDNGCFNNSIVRLAGLRVQQAEEEVLRWLEETGTLLHRSTLVHSYPHCWRHKKPLIYRTTPQWFMQFRFEGLDKRLQAEIAKTTWIPEWGQARIAAMVEQRPEWCISRQRVWGTPIAFILHKETGDLHPRMQELLETIAQKIEQEGIKAWYHLSLETLLGDEAALYQKSQDVLDVWFDSGVVHSAVKRHAFPADLYLEGSDQYRGWFQSSLLSAVALKGVAPYKAVLTHGFTVDSSGHKMSKSLGNVIEPEKVIDSVGADVLRLWVASTDYRSEMTISDEILKRASDTYRRIRNTLRFLLANLHDFEPERDVLPADALLTLDAWMIEKTKLLQEEIQKAYDQFQFHLVYQKIHQFCAVDLGGFYLDVIKDRQYTLKKSSPARLSAQTALYWIVESLTRWIAPILSFTAEEVWSFLPGKREHSVFLTEWVTHFPVVSFREGLSAAFWEDIVSLRQVVNKALETARATGLIGSPLEAEIVIFAKEPFARQLRLLKEELRFVFITSSTIVEEKDLESPHVVVRKAPGSKCVRCWHYQTTVGQHAEDPLLCGRCVLNVRGNGEERNYA